LIDSCVKLLHRLRSELLLPCTYWHTVKFCLIAPCLSTLTYFHLPTFFAEFEVDSENSKVVVTSVSKDFVTHRPQVNQVVRQRID